MASKYFTVEAKPTIPASLQQAAAFGQHEVLFDWTAFQVPRGANKLVNVTALVRPKGDAGPTGNKKAFELIFSKSNTQSLGAINGGSIKRPSNDFLGNVEFAASHYHSQVLTSTMVASLSRGSDAGIVAGPLVLQGDITSGDNVGFDTLYVGAMTTAASSFDFTSINTIQTTEAASATIHCDGSSMDLREHFLPGDILHTATTVGAADADSLIGTVLSVDSDTNITLTDTAAVTHVDGTIIMNIHPIRLILQFER
jgi:hypothetical protein|tara:strand:- start:284 stop:1048 length:765 start_codon:yes stop_codon:yes gene_type:complete